MKRVLPAGLAALTLLASPAAAQTPQVSGRTRVFLRLDPALDPARDGEAPLGAVGTFSVLARGPWHAEASGWLAHAPGAVAYADQPASGDVRTLLVGYTDERAWVTAGRQRTVIGGLRLQAVDGLTAGLVLPQRRAALSVRLDRPLPAPGEVFGDGRELGVEGELRPIEDVRIVLGVLDAREPEVPSRTRWSASTGWTPSPNATLQGGASFDVGARDLAELRAEGLWRARADLWLRLFARHTDAVLLLPADELLAVFADQESTAAGAGAEWVLVPEVQLHGEVSGIPGDDGESAGQARVGADLRPASGVFVTTEGTGRVQREGWSGTARTAARWPLVGETWFGTAEALGDLELIPGEATRRAVLGRLGLGYSANASFTGHATVEYGRGDFWRSRVAGFLLVEYAFGAPARWGSGP